MEPAERYKVGLAPTSLLISRRGCVMPERKSGRGFKRNTNCDLLNYDSLAPQTPLLIFKERVRQARAQRRERFLKNYELPRKRVRLIVLTFTSKDSMAEDVHTEFKSSFNDSVIETLVAFANTKGGKVLVGVDDKGIPVKNYSVGKETIQRSINEIKNKTQPAVIPDVRMIAFKGSDVLEFSIQEFPVKPISFKGRYYKRVKNSNHQLSPVEIADMSMQSLQLSWDAYPAPGVSVSDIDKDKAERFINKVNAIGRFSLSGNLEENLKKLKLINNRTVSNAAVLLFNKGDINYNVHLGRFKDPSHIIDDKMCSGTLFDVLEDIMKYLVSQIKVAFEITGTTTSRTEIFEYPLPALRELVLNSLIHRDYLSPVDLQIKVFDRHISFFNPGKLFGDLTVAELNTDSYQSQARNKLLAELFYLSGDIEKYGSGFLRVRKEIAAYPTMKFNFKEVGNGFLAELSYSIQKLSSGNIDVGKDVGKAVGKDVGKASERKVYNLLAESPSMIIPDIALRLNLSERTIERIILKLKKGDKIKRVGGRKDGYWEIAE